MLLKSEYLQIQGKGGGSIWMLVLTLRSLFDVSLLSLQQHNLCSMYFDDLLKKNEGRENLLFNSRELFL